MRPRAKLPEMCIILFPVIAIPGSILVVQYILNLFKIKTYRYANRKSD